MQILFLVPDSIGILNLHSHPIHRILHDSCSDVLFHLHLHLEDFRNNTILLWYIEFFVSQQLLKNNNFISKLSKIKLVINSFLQYNDASYSVVGSECSSFQVCSDINPCPLLAMIEANFPSPKLDFN